MMLKKKHCTTNAYYSMLLNASSSQLVLNCKYRQTQLPLMALNPTANPNNHVCLTNFACLFFQPTG